MFEQLGLIGCGLMGGSFALAMKKAGLVKRVVGYSKSPSTTDRARQLGVIDVEAPSALLAVAGADIVLVAVPVAATEATLKSIKHLVTPQMLVMDVGSTKADVVQAARRALRDQVGSFVPAHPIAGREVSGVEHADPELYAGRQVILTPTERTLAAHLRCAEELWTRLGCRVTSMAPEAHDAAFAAVSHLPHLLAFAMMQSVIRQENSDYILSLAGTGFRDFTRIAASDPRCGATSCAPTAKKYWCSHVCSRKHCRPSSTPFRQTTTSPWKTCSPWPAKPARTGAWAHCANTKPPDVQHRIS